jgi:predicted secreted protein
MATHAGSEGLVYIGLNQVAEVKSWSLEITSDTVDASIIGTSWRKNQATIKSWSGSIEAFWDETDTQGQGGMAVGSTVTLNLYPEGNTTGDKYFTGDAIITSKSISGAFDGIVEASFSFTGTGAVTESTVA